MEEATRVASRRSLLADTGRCSLRGTRSRCGPEIERGPRGRTTTKERCDGGDEAVALRPQLPPPGPDASGGSTPGGRRSPQRLRRAARPPEWQGHRAFHRGATHPRLPVRGSVSRLEIHTFHLEDGTIHGLGTALRGTAGSFTILGGTGRYAGVSGSYVATQRQREHGGNGTADFHLKLAA